MPAPGRVQRGRRREVDVHADPRARAAGLIQPTIWDDITLRHIHTSIRRDELLTNRSTMESISRLSSLLETGQIPTEHGLPIMNASEAHCDSANSTRLDS